MLAEIKLRKSQGFEVIPQEMFGNAALLAKRGKDSDLLQFCNGKLMVYSDNLSGDIHTYLRLVGQMTSQRGAGQYEVQLNEGRHGPLNALMFKWVEEPDTITVVYAAPSAQVKETVSMLYSVTKKCPK